MDSNRVILAGALILLAATVACGTGGGVTINNPQGNFSNASLKGSYVYHIHGFDSTAFPYREVGVFTADGSGHITGGSDDSSFGSTSGLTGAYSVAADGTGLITLSSGGSSITLAITMVSGSKLQLIEADGFANAGGTAELQNTNATGTTPSGTFVFGIHQEISAENSGPAAEVGSLTISSGSASGNMDANLAGVFSSPNITATFTAPIGPGRGTGTLVNSGTNFTTSFVYYLIDVNKFVFLVTNINAVGSGAAELQNGAIGNGPSGNYVFGSRGDDSNFFAGVATVGQFNAASGTMTGTEDFNVDGNVTTNANLSSCYAPSANGRVVVNDLSGNTCSASISQVFWMVSPSRAFFLNAGNATVEDGTADLQQVQSFSASTFSGQYSLAMDGVDTGAADGTPQLLSRVGALQFDGTGKLTLNEVANGSFTGSGAQNPGTITGTYSVGSTGRIAATFNGGSFQNVVMYAVSGSQAYVLQADPSFITSGKIQLQQ